MKRTMAKDKKTAVVENMMQVVTLQVGAEEYGLDINSISEVIRPLKITPLPRMPEFIEGVINLRGVIIPIVDLRKRFCVEKNQHTLKTIRIIIIRGAFSGISESGKELLGLVVDEVKEVLYMPLKDIEPAPASAIGKDAEFIIGMGKVGERLIILINSTKILSQQERSALAEAGNVGY